MAYTVWIEGSEGWHPHVIESLDDVLETIAVEAYGKTMASIRITKDVDVKIVEGSPASAGLVFPPGVRSVETPDGWTHTLHDRKPTT